MATPEPPTTIRRRPLNRWQIAVLVFIVGTWVFFVFIGFVYGFGQVRDELTTITFMGIAGVSNILLGPWGNRATPHKGDQR